MVVSERATWWLARPSRVAAWPRGRARVALAFLLLALLIGAALADTPAAPLATGQAALLEALRHDLAFYPAVADLARADPADGVAVALPTLPILAAHVPDLVAVGMLALLLAALLWVGSARVLSLLADLPGRLAALALLVAGLVAGAVLATDSPALGWATLLVALALLLRTPARWIEPAAIGACAALIDPAALAAVLAMALVAAGERRRAEAAGWSLTLLLAGPALLLHRQALDSAVGGVLPAATDEAGRWSTLIEAGLSPLAPQFASIVAVLALAGWLALADPLGRRVVAVAAIGLALEGVGRAHPAVVAAPLLPLGLVFAPDTLRDLARRALDRRRITVTRVAR